MTARDDKTIVQPTGNPALDATQPTVAGGGAGTPMTGGGQAVTAPITPPKIPDVELEAELGRGGMGVVYRGRQPYLDRRVAVKLLLLEQGRGSEDFVKRFQREAKILAGLSHPHIVGCYSAGVTGDQHPYLVMEFIDGPNLRDWVKKQGPLAPTQAVTLIRDIAKALEHANANGIIHRDVKPENVLLAKRESARDGEFPWTGKLVDLGLARPQAKDAAGEGMHLTMQGVLMGTPSTMAPEQFNDPDGVDFRADIYGLGCVLYQALTGMPAFASSTLGEILSAKVSGVIPNPKTRMQDLPRGVCDLVTWMLARDRAQRPQTYHELIARCDELAADPTSARRVGGSRAPLVVGAIGAVIAAGVAVAVLTHGRPEPTPAAPVVTQATAPASTAPAPAAPVFGDAIALVPEHGLPTGWETHGDAGWAPSEEHPGALSGHHGIYLHALEPKPLRIEATLHPGSSTVLAIGVAVGDEVVAASVKSLTASFYGSIDSGTLDKPGANLETGLQSLPASKDVTVVLTVVGKTLTVEMGGHDLKPISLAGAPTHLVLDADGVSEAPAEVGHLTVRYAK